MREVSCASLICLNSELTDKQRKEEEIKVKFFR